MSAAPRDTEILYGVHPVLEALRAGRRHWVEICVAAGKGSSRLSPVLDEARGRQVPVREVSDRELAALTRASNHQGVAARVGPYPYDGPPESFRAEGQSPFWLLLDGVVDPRNLGAMLRTALGAGVEGVVIAKDRSASATSAVSRASAGALEHVKLVRVTNLNRTIEAMKSDGLWIAGLDADGERLLFEADLSGPLGLVVGGEGRGLRPLVRRNCDFLIRIPQSGPVDSLNASTAGAVALYEAVRQRTQHE
jgi:23S rRNA (guanosine2251-2'-O)-methyltransferase